MELSNKIYRFSSLCMLPLYRETEYRLHPFQFLFSSSKYVQIVCYKIFKIYQYILRFCLPEGVRYSDILRTILDSIFNI